MILHLFIQPSHCILAGVCPFHYRQRGPITIQGRCLQQNAVQSAFDALCKDMAPLHFNWFSKIRKAPFYILYAPATTPITLVCVSI